jgi:uncharacterized protein (TIGR00369 family)
VINDNPAAGSEFVPADANFETRVRASFARQKIMDLIDADLVRVAPGRCEIHLPYRENLSQQHGFFHGGITTTIADSACGYAGFTLMPADASVLTIEYKVNFLAPADGDLLIATGTVVKPGRTIIVSEGRVVVVKDGRERACATITNTMMVMQGLEEKD